LKQWKSTWTSQLCDRAILFTILSLMMLGA